MLSFRFLWVALGGATAVVLFPQFVWWWAAAVLALPVIDVVLCASPRQLTVERQPARAIRHTQSGVVETDLVSTGRRTLRGSVRDGWQPTAGAVPAEQAVVVPAGGRLTLRTTLTPRRRGEVTSEHVTVRSLGPLGMAGRQVTHRVAHAVRVLPEFRSRKHLPAALQRLRELDGATAVQLRGAGTEFDSLRDYVRGDDVRSIDWRATARRQDAQGQHLVVRTWRPERDRRVVICIDASRTSAARIAEEPRLDASIEASLLLGALASQAGDRVNVLAFHRELVSRASSAEKGEFLSVLSHATSQVEPVLVEADFTHLPHHVAAVTGQKSLVVILTAVESPSMQEGLLPVLPQLTATHQVVVASVQDPQLPLNADQRDTATEVYSAAAAERELLEAEAVAAELGSMGVEVIQAAPDDLPPALTDHYLRLKAAGKL